MKIFKSFSNAIKGFWCSVRTERHLRFHLFAAFCVGWLGLHLGLSRGEMAALLVTFGLVIGMELANTAIEVLTDYVIPSYHPAAKAAKDIAAAAVFICAIFAVGEAVIFFWRPAELKALLLWFIYEPWRVPMACGICLIGVLFVAFGPAGYNGYKDREKKQK